MYDSNALGKRIVTLRKEKYIKQRELAEMVGKSSSYICDIEKGRTNPSLKVLYSISEKLEIDVFELFVSRDKEN